MSFEQEQALRELQRLQRGEPPTPRVTFEPQERKPLTDKGREQIVSMTFTSSKGGVPHVVVLGPDGLVRCTCMAMLSIESRPAGCWAMAEFRRVAGIFQP